MFELNCLCFDYLCVRENVLEFVDVVSHFVK